jgi:MAATS-type transcriptional repressor, C-terminal region.
MIRSKAFKSFCIELVTRIEDDLYLRRVLSLFLLKCAYTGNVQVCQERTFDARQEKSEALSKFFEKAQSKGTLSADLDPKTMTLALSCFMRGIAMEYLENPDSFSLREEAPKLFRIFFRKWN